jgi:hypothetical protein
MPNVSVSSLPSVWFTRSVSSATRSTYSSMRACNPSEFSSTGLTYSSPSILSRISCARWRTACVIARRNALGRTGLTSRSSTASVS